MASNAAQVPAAAQTAFQHLPPMQSQAQPMPVKLPAGPKPLVARAQQSLCAIPLLDVTPHGQTQYAIRTITPPKDPVAAMRYAKTPPVCDTARK